MVVVIVERFYQAEGVSLIDRYIDFDSIDDLGCAAITIYWN
jgi:hypothetical protein